MWETWVQSLGWEDPLEKRKDTTPVLWPGEFRGLYSPWDCKESDMTERLTLTWGQEGFLSLNSEEEKGYPLQYSGLENSMDCIVSPWGRKESDTTVQLSVISILARHGIWLLLTKKDTRLPWWFSW